MSDADLIHVRDDGGIRIAVIDRPPANALDETLLIALRSLAESATADDQVRGVLLTANGPFFCAGFDLQESRRDDDAVRRMVAAYRTSHRALLAVPKPTVALVQGHAIAGGLVLALACDRHVFTEGDYKVGLNEVAIGAAFPAAAMEIVRLKAGAAAAELLLDAQIGPASEAVRLGLVPQLVPADSAFEQALGLAARLAAYPQKVYANTKTRLIREAVARIDEMSIEAELAIAALWSDPESQAARHAQIESLR